MTKTRYTQLELPAAYQAAASTRPRPRLPPEIWVQIAPSLLLLDEPIWSAWVHYRSVSRVFKQVIEDFYLAHVLRGARIYVRCDSKFHFAPTVYDYYGEYWFDGIDDEDGRLAILRLNEDRCTFGRTNSDKETSRPLRHMWVVRD